MRILIVGAGIVGTNLAQELSQEGHDIAIIDEDTEKIRRISDTLDVMSVRGNACLPSVLVKAGIRNMQMVIAVTNKDEINLMVCFLAAKFKIQKRFARLRSMEFTGVDQIFPPEELFIDHAINPGGRGGEGRSFIGFNFRMMELQGALGLAQLAKLDDIIAFQKKNNARMKAALEKIPGITFRNQLDEDGDSATFLAFFLRDVEQTKAVQAALQDNGAGAVYFADNTWHYYPKWEHLLKGSTLSSTGWPFSSQDGRRRVVYDQQALPKSAEILDRTLVYQVPVILSEDRLAQIKAAAAVAAAV